jgi:hypothetical protein
MNILNYLFAETVMSETTNEADTINQDSEFFFDETAPQQLQVHDDIEQLNAVTNSVFHSVATNEQPKQSIVGSRDSSATENAIVRSAVQYKVGSNTFDAQSVGIVAQTFH